MRLKEITIRERLRLAVLAAVILAGLSALALSLWRMQIRRGAYYEASLENQSVRRIRVPGVRGRIFDRHGVCMADNEPNFCIVVYLEDVRRGGKRRRLADEAWNLIRQVGELIGREPEVGVKEIERHLSSRRPLPLVAWERVDEECLARLAESGSNLPAVDIAVKPFRNYPFGKTACHVLGYVGSVEKKEDDLDHHYYLPDMAGRRGIEKEYDDLLAGRAGGELVRVDVSGFRRETLSKRDPEFGNDLLLAIDLRVQQIAERAIADTVGAVVIMDPRNGDVLAMASTPCFDLREFQPVLLRSTWDHLVGDARSPLLNRVASGLYAPGSLFKPVVAMAAMNRGGISESTTYSCSGYIELGGDRFRCFRETAHGTIGFREALEFSCNVFFYNLGMECGFDHIYETARELGLGQKTGIDLDHETAGLLPSRQWHYSRTGRPWRAGDTCNISIGQGSLMVSPIQMAVVASAIANGGRVYEPRLLIGRRAHAEQGFQTFPPRLRKTMHWSESSLAVVKDGMKAVIQEKSGTGHLAMVPGVVMGGKTGTAEYGRKAELRQHGWMMVFAPFDDPRYAAVIVLDDSLSGGAAVGPRMGEMMAQIFQLAGGPGGAS